MTGLVERMKERIEDFRAKRRGERRVAPAGATGRVYERRNKVEPAARTAPAAPGPRVKTKATARLHMKIERADGTVEHRVVPASVEQLK